jgi:hypothetical protein
MATTPIITQPMVGPYPTLPLAPASLDLTFTSADNVNGNSFTADPLVTVVPQGTITGSTVGGNLILVWNTDTNPHNITITSQPDAAGRSGDIATYTVGAGVHSAFKLSQVLGWADGFGNVTLTADNPLVKLAVIQR